MDDAVREADRLTERDHTVIRLLDEHRVATAAQIARVAYPNPTRARCRLVLLARRGVLARFRPYQRPGSQPWHYTLGLLGAALLAAQNDQPLPRPSEITRRVLKLRDSTTLRHQHGVVEFFTLLHATARTTPGASLGQWWPEHTAAKATGDLVRPDGYGEWTEPTPNGTSSTTAFFLEHDLGTERYPTLLAKIDRYHQLAEAGVDVPVLFVLPTAARETGLHRVIGDRVVHTSQARARIATTYAGLLREGADPSARIWWPTGDTSNRYRLSALPNPHPRQPPPTYPVEA